MLQSTGLSIRYKILMFMTLLPVVVLAAYLVIAIRVFESDKVAYVFESSSEVARTFSAQTTSSLEGLLANSEPAMQEFLSSHQFGVVSKGFFAVKGPVQWISIFEPHGPQGLTAVDHIERTSGSFLRDWTGTLPARVLPELERQGRLVLAPFDDDRILLGERVKIPAQGSEPEHILLFVILARAPSVSQSFRISGQTESYLIDMKGQVLFGPPGTHNTDIREQVPLRFLEAATPVHQGTEEVQIRGNDSYLASFSLTNFGQLYAVSMVPKKAALMAVQTLIRKSVVFFIVVICFTIIASLMGSSTLTASLTSLFEATQKVAEGRFDIRVPVKSRDEIGGLAASFNLMANEVSRLVVETAEKARMESELKTAQTVQETLFPPNDAKMGGTQICGYYEPASECGGDWWHYGEIENTIYFWIGDATGHGAPAALITSAAKSAATVIESLRVGPASALELLNRSVYQVSKGRIMMTFFIAAFDPVTRVLTYSNASHEAPFLIRKAADHSLSKKDLIPLNETNSPRLGQGLDSKFSETSIQLEKGDRIFFYTDGLTDIQTPEKKPWGEREFVKGLVATNQGATSLQNSVKDLVARFQDYRKGSPLIDDVTFFMIEIEGQVE